VEALDPNQASLGTGTSAPVAAQHGTGELRLCVREPVLRSQDPASCGSGYTCRLGVRPEIPSRKASASPPARPTLASPAPTPRTACPAQRVLSFNACSTAAQPRKTCRQFCNVDPRIVGYGARSFCNTGVSSRPDQHVVPACARGPATHPRTRPWAAPPACFCFIYSGEITDCACLDQSRGWYGWCFVRGLMRIASPA